MVQKIKNLIVDTTAFIKNAYLHDIAENIITVQEVVDEVTNRRQLRRLVVLPYDLTIKDVFPEYIKKVTDFSKKTGDYTSLSATDIKVIALTYQLEKEHVGTNHLRKEPLIPSVKVTSCTSKSENSGNINSFRVHRNEKQGEHFPNSDISEHKLNIDGLQTAYDYENLLRKDALDVELREKFATLDGVQFDDSLAEVDIDKILIPIRSNDILFNNREDESDSDESDDGIGWITPNNIKEVLKTLNANLFDDQPVKVACLTNDFAMQNVLKQIGLNISTLDGRMIKQIKTFILRCYTCFKTANMDKVFCPKCGHRTLKKVAISINEDGETQMHINMRKPISPKGKKFSIPTFKGGKHSNNPVLTEDQPVPQQRPTRQARMKNNPLDSDFVTGYSPFVMRDINSKSAALGIQQGGEIKYWMRKNPNESRRRRK